MKKEKRVVIEICETDEGMECRGEVSGYPVNIPQSVELILDQAINLAVRAIVENKDRLEKSVAKHNAAHPERAAESPEEAYDKIAAEAIVHIGKAIEGFDKVALLTEVANKIGASMNNPESRTFIAGATKELTDKVQAAKSNAFDSQTFNA